MRICPSERLEAEFEEKTPRKQGKRFSAQKSGRFENLCNGERDSPYVAMWRRYSDTGLFESGSDTVFRETEAQLYNLLTFHLKLHSPLDRVFILSDSVLLRKEHPLLCI